MPQKIKLAIALLTLPERIATRYATLRSLGATDWDGDLQLVIDDGEGPPSLKRLARNYTRAMQVCARAQADFALLLEDDLTFNRHLAHNLRAWLKSFRPKDVGSLYSSTLGRRCGTQAIITNPTVWATLHHTATLAPAATVPIDQWLHTMVSPKNFRVHQPSLVDHNAHVSAWGGPAHKARNFDPDFCA